MALPFFDSGARRKRDQVVAIDLGGRTTKAVFLQRKEEKLFLNCFALLDAPLYEKSLSPELLAEHLKAVSQALDGKGQLTALAVGAGDALMRHAELPRMPVEDLRQVLKNNSRNYLQEDLANHVFDCFIVPPRPATATGEPAKSAALPLKQKVLVAGAKAQLIQDYQAAIKAAGLVASHIVPALLGPVNAFEAARREEYYRSVVALVDIGFKHSSIAIIAEGELVLSRVVGIGGDRFTAGLAESLGISYAEADGIKMGMAREVQAALESLLTPLCRELRASIDFFEHQQDRAVANVYVSGGSAQSALILQLLQSHLMVECATWTPTSFLEMALPPQQLAEIHQLAPQLTTALGAALTAL